MTWRLPLDMQVKVICRNHMTENRGNIVLPTASEILKELHK